MTAMSSYSSSSSPLPGAPPNELFLLYPDPPPVDLVRSLSLGGYGWTAASAHSGLAVSDEWTGAIVSLVEDAERGWLLCRDLRRRDVPVEPLLVLVPGDRLHELDERAELFDDFLIAPFHPAELDARLKHLLWRVGRGVRPEMVEYGPLRLNTETYQAQIDGKPLDLTYMEYELLRFLAATPGRVFSRETLLNQVWGYEYYGGARTVDVHIRRLRAKLGQEHANLIQTIRSVGYKLGQSRWG